jgi:hypothetical protein
VIRHHVESALQSSRIVTRIASWASALLWLAALACAPAEPVSLPPLPSVTDPATVSYREQVQPVLERRCVVCHGCYDAPCQLRLSSQEGTLRGASKEVVYDSARLVAMEPTRLFLDAHGEKQWRARDFFSVLGSPRGGAPEPLLLRMLALGLAAPFAPDARLPDSVPLDINRSLSCPTPQEFDDYAARHPQGGMPYGMAPLTEDELGTLAAWVGQGAPFPEAPLLPAAAVAQVEQWEAFLNGGSLKQRITARYLFEHWVFAHLYFEDHPKGPFFRIVRSRMPPGAPVEPIATRRPYDDPGVSRFYYRLEPIRSSIVHKTHIVYALGDARMKRLTELFLASDWSPTRWPGYEPREASNPFVSFDQIPAGARYRFLLDDAHYFVMTFIRGPVCRGQVAVDVIEDHFFVSFLDPDHDISAVDPAYLDEAKHLLSLPAERGSTASALGAWLEYNREQVRYLDARAKAYDALDPERLGPDLDWIWDGDSQNPDALLTVFRHFDNATVVRGFVGEIPETAWVIDFPVFERIYYNLVAGFDVFGNVGHQLATRLYMDHLRMQSENLFLSFLPADRREEIRASWYVGATRKVDYFHTDRIRSAGHGTRIRYDTRDVKAELLERILERNAAVAGPPDGLNRCGAPPCDRPDAAPVELRAERALRRLTGVRGSWVATLPELSLLRVRGSEGARDALYSLVRNAAQRRPHERGLAVRRGRTPRAGEGHAQRGARAARQLPELHLRRRGLGHRRVHPLPPGRAGCGRPRGAGDALGRPAYEPEVLADVRLDPRVRQAPKSHGSRSVRPRPLCESLKVARLRSKSRAGVARGSRATSDHLGPW